MVLQGILLSALAGLAVAAPDLTKVLVLTADNPESSDGDLQSLLKGFPSLQARQAAWPAAVPAAIEWAEVLAVEITEKTSFGDAEAALLLEPARAGKGLVLQGGLPEKLGESKAALALLGIKRWAKPERSAERQVERPREDSLILVLDQSQPITECLPHFQHQSQAAELELVPEAVALALAVPVKAKAEGNQRPAHPVLWKLRHGSGWVVVSLLDFRQGPSRDLARLIAARSAHWVHGRRLSSSVQGEFKLAAELLAQDPAGAAQLLPPMEGFFCGRQIAPTMSYRGADWLVRLEREKYEQPDKVLDCLEIQSGQTVVDLGAGVGYFTLRMARRVGAEGKVLAVEIQEEMLRLLKDRASKEDLQNIELILAKEKDPRLPENAADLVLMVDVYHELSDPKLVLECVRKSLKEKGRVVLVEYRGEDPDVPIKPLHRTLERQVRAEMDFLGFRWLETKGFLPHQNILIFGKK